ncbi:MAG: pyridoxal 5'-phosphate synthase glutaminase subunit PdxT [Actinobacteria bacterium]|nr:pyridoxal 5'-phosphate synthase glutaminase subunit PdxT [Actinomycetota bacterium]NCG36030.1 pyridoxal 5'-phosphate synthase glutaminase subunit PdxT [Actinomycetota bacterium]
MVSPTVGVLALQGAFAAHALILERLGVSTKEIRADAQLDDVDALVMPGGESTTMSMLLERSSMLEPLRTRIAGGLPVFGTCAGMILLSSEVMDGRPDQRVLGSIDIRTRRNGYGRQTESFESDLEIAGMDEPFHGIFIRAPIVERVGESVSVLASVDGDAVLCQQANVTVASFHPELADDDRLHSMWLKEFV